ncbi:hypothetical protein [Legionella yabuuchiae]|uniref:hypothetical protein n=1 Tax=Legionella yabuuchiae TaxID=376727 RepID=UPI0010569BC5|nr:hypothetical protein [Legionella yabuuchiae]
MNHIRSRYGKDSKSDKRQFEIVFSKYRKSITKLDEAFQQGEFDELEYTRKLLKNSKDTLEAFGVPIAEQKRYLEGIESLFTFPHKNHGLHEIECLYEQAVLNKARELFGMRHSNWGPRSSFNDFMKEIREHGKLVVHGKFGKPFYEWASPSVLKEDHHGIKIQYYKSKDYRHPEGSKLLFHNIVIVGAMKNKSAKDLVLYLDPNDPLDPSHSPQVYAMSYESFCTRLTNIYSEYREASIGGSEMTHNPLVLKGPFALTAGPEMESEYDLNDFMVIHYGREDLEYYHNERFILK